MSLPSVADSVQPAGATVGSGPPEEATRRTAGGDVFRAVAHNRKALAGVGLLLGFVVLALIPGQIAPDDPRAKIYTPGLGPSWHHLFGTTAYGEDVFSQLVWGTRQSLLIAVLVGGLATVIGVVVGVSAGYLGGTTDGILSLITDVILVIPIFPLIIVIAAYERNSGFFTLVIVLGLLGWSYGARQLRSQTLSLRTRDFLEAARVRGERKSYVIVKEILPTMTSLIVASFLGAAVYAVLFAAGLQFIGLGDPNSQSWGTMLYWAENNEALGAGMTYWAIMPGVFVALLGAAFALLNYAFDEISSPALRLRKLETTGVDAEQETAVPIRPPDEKNILEVRDLSVAYASDHGPVVAVDRVSFELGRGEFLGIVGESACGKSTLVYAIARLLGAPLAGEITGGQVFFKGRDMVTLADKELRHIRWRDYSVVMQSAMNALNPVLTVADQMRDACEAHSTMSKREIEQRSKEVLRLVSIDPVHLHSYPHQLSGGMRQRAMIAMALLFTPELIVMDEPTSALDVVGQRSLMVQIKELQERLGFAVIFVTHDMSLVRHFSDRLLVMYAAQVAELGLTRQVFAKPLHPYTTGLLEAFPSIHGPKEHLLGIPGQPPDLLRLPPGCRFAPRCPHAADRCRVERPALYRVNGELVRCFLHEQAEEPVAVSTEGVA
ncbi:MAG TPA: dipeptide/oligopeptide/nickel ABC transporter permease/ATP-binding protein [Gaiellaceae bacterium]|nr:dipeptide/oligopeptide/nickel ABC transporter permease/ATP-binding protein [Gaiellaceae bacterium]